MVGLVLVCGSAAAQESPRQTMGDPEARARVGEEVRAIYDGVDGWVFALTRDDVLGLDGAYGTQLQGGQVDGRLLRLLATAWTEDGTYGAEFYLRGDTLLHVYEAFEYFPERAPSDAWVNFKGLPSWERRTYFEEGEVAYAEVQGNGAVPGADGASLEARARRVLARLRASADEQE